MQVEVMSILLMNLYYSIQLAPVVLVVVGVIRAVILFTGQKREFEDWTRNPLMSVLSIIFLPGTALYIGIRYIVSKLFRMDVKGVSGTTTYGELNLFLRVDKPPRVGVVLVGLFLTIVFSIFSALLLLMVPAVYFLGNAPVVLISWYVAIGVLFNSSIRSGDLSLVAAALQKRPRSGALELITVLATLVIIYYQLMGVPT